MSTKIISEIPIVSGDFFTVNEVNLELQDGTKRTYKNMYRKPSVSVLPLNEEGDVYLIRQYRYMHRSYMVEAVAGMLDMNEDPLHAAKRELEEEAGLTAKKWRNLGKVNSAGSIAVWKQDIYLAQDVSETDQNLEPDEDISVVKVSLEKAVEMVLQGEIMNSPTIIAILMTNELKRRGEL